VIAVLWTVLVSGRPDRRGIGPGAGPRSRHWFDGAMGVPRMLWIDATAGVAGDMLVGGLVDVGVPLPTMQAAVDAVLPGAARLTARPVTRAGLRATKVDVDVVGHADPERRTWAEIRRMLDAAGLTAEVLQPAGRTFQRLAEAEGQVHGVPPERVHFHEVGAVDAVADVVATCAGVAALAVDRVAVSAVALGSGQVLSEHGILPLPAPAVLELARGRLVMAGGDGAPVPTGELATPTGVALVTTLATVSGPLPAMTVLAVGIGAGTRDRPDRPNVVRLLLGTASEGASTPAWSGGAPDAVVVETNVDDLDPRIWPDVLRRLLEAGALDAWLTPILMKKGRPAHTLHVLARPEDEPSLAGIVLAHTSTLGVRVTPVRRNVLERSWCPVQVAGRAVRIKIGHRHGRVYQATPEFEDAAQLAAATGIPLAQVLAMARAAAADAGLAGGAEWPGPDC